MNELRRAARQARRLVYLPELVGTVDGIALDGSGVALALTAAERTVVLVPGTVFDDVLGRLDPGVVRLTAIEQLQSGVDRVEVSGFLVVTDGATGASHVRATRVARVARLDGDDPSEVVTGVTAASSTGRFELRDAGGQSIAVEFAPGSVTDSSLFEPGTDRLREGVVVLVTGQLESRAIDDAANIRRPLSNLQPLAPQSGPSLDGEIEGLITSPPGPGTEFRVGSQRVRLLVSTQFEGGARVDLTLDQRVRVEGNLLDGDDRLLEAERITIEAEADVRLEDAAAERPTAADATGLRSFASRIGVTVVVRPDTVLKDDSDFSDDGRLDLDDLAPGDIVDVRGFFDGSARLVALTLERDDEDQGCELRAPVSGSEIVGSARHYTIDGRPGLVVADPTTTAEVVAPGESGEFEADAPADCLIRPVGTDLGGTPVDAGFVADEVE